MPLLLEIKLNYFLFYTQNNCTYLNLNQLNNSRNNLRIVF